MVHDALRVLVVGDDPLARTGLANLLGDATDLEVVAQVPPGSALADMFRAYEPDSVLWDVGWHRGADDWKDQLSELVNAGASVVTLVADAAQSAEARSAGARGLLGREANPAAISAALQAVNQGLVAGDPELWQGLIPSGEAEPIEALTAREREVLGLLAEGLPNKSIAYRLQISEHTVKYHVNAILRKLRAQSRTEAVVQATRRGLILL